MVRQGAQGLRHSEARWEGLSNTDDKQVTLINLSFFFYLSICRDNIFYCRDNILAQKEQDPDPDQALRYYQVKCIITLFQNYFSIYHMTVFQNLLYYLINCVPKQATFNYTENLREVLTNLRLRIV